MSAPSTSLTYFASNPRPNTLTGSAIKILTRCLHGTSPSSLPFTATRWLIHELTYRRTNHDNFHVHGYHEEGTTTTPFDMTVLNRLDRFHLAGDVVDRVPRLQELARISSILAQ